MNKRNYKRILALIAMLLLVAVVASACAQTGANSNGVIKPPSGGPYAFFFQYFGRPIQRLIEWTAQTIGGNNGFALGIIIISFAVRLILLPLGLNQSYKATTQQEKIKAIQPQLKLIQDKQNEVTDPAVKQQISQLMMQVYKENNMSLVGGIGCLPLLIQLPFMSGIYQAVLYSKEIGSATFFNIPLGKSSIIIAIVATLFYVVQSYLAIQLIPEEQRKQQQTALWMNPIITFIFSMISSAAIGLYFLVGGIILVIQQLIINYIVQPRVRKTIDKSLAENPVKEVVTEESINANISGYHTTTTTTADGAVKTTGGSKASQHARNKNRNVQQNKKD